MNHSPWILTANGATYYLGGPRTSANEHQPADIAHALACINRYTGHTRRPYSVAEHSLLCMEIAQYLDLPPVVQLACLMHDAHEAYTGDCASPAKHALGSSWDVFERAHASHLRRWFGLSTTFLAHRAAIKSIDLMAQATERRDLMPWDEASSEPWPILDTPGAVVPPADWINLASMARAHTHWTEWRDEWLRHFDGLRARVNDRAQELMKKGGE